MKFAVYFLAVSLLLACKEERKQLPDISGFLPEQQQTPDSTARPRGQRIFKGLFVTGRNMSNFRSCDSERDNYYVVDSTHQLDELYNTIFQSSPAFPFEYVYVELMGELQLADKAAAMHGFDSSIVVYDILTFEQKNYRNTCIPYDFWAIGNKPDWSLQVSAREGILALKDYSSNEVFLFEYFDPKIINDEVYTYYSNNYATQTSINAVFKRVNCSDGVTGNDYEYSSTVIINGKRFTGCGIRGSEVK